MANIKSAKKRVRVNAEKAARNKAVKSDLKTALKKAAAAVADNADNKEEVVRQAIKKVDMACTKGILHKNNAARKKSALAKSLAK
ncbi:MAG: 30S ribosomal protein S20 [Ruminococcus sp.]|nr:30S ribosomal protein S20 [Ruminococcus sp.]